MKTNTHQYSRHRYFERILVFLVVFLVSAAVRAQNTIKNVTAFTQAGSEVVRVDLANPVTTPPTGFLVQKPARIVLDFAGAKSSVQRTLQRLNVGNLRSVQVVPASERTRVVIGLKQAVNYQATVSGKTVFLRLDTATLGTGKAPARAFAENRNARVMELRNIDFRRGADNSGRVVVDLPNNRVGVDIKPQGKDLVVEFLKSSLPPELNKRFDVTDFGTPVQNITVKQNGDKVRMTIRARGQWEHSAYQSDTQLVVELHPIRIDPDKISQGVGYRGDKLSLNFQSVEVRALLNVIADFTNFNIITSDSVTGDLTLRLQDVPWDQALDVILRAKDLGMRKSGNVIWIAPQDEIESKEKRELEAKAEISDLEPLRTQTFRLNYAKAIEVENNLKVGGGEKGVGMLSEKGSVIAESRTNMLFVTDVPSVLERIADMITKLDVPVRQVMIEARIVEADDGWGRSLGARLGVGSDDAPATRNTVRFDSSLATAPGKANDNTLYNFPAQEGAGNIATAAVSIFTKGAARFLTLEISALEADRRGKIISSPRIVTANQTEALIRQGVKIPYTTGSGTDAKTEFKDAVLELQVTPQITPEGGVMMDVNIKNDSQDGINIRTSELKTNVLVENGGTVVIGGIYKMTDRRGVSKVPLLGDIPVLGNLFKTREKSTSKEELLVFLTPRIVSERAIFR